jgi:hypothetical protein
MLLDVVGLWKSWKIVQNCYKKKWSKLSGIKRAVHYSLTKRKIINIFSWQKNTKDLQIASLEELEERRRWVAGILVQTQTWKNVNQKAILLTSCILSL